jgi:FHS family Na+ dependent glucose MFS transporter 1
MTHANPTLSIPPTPQAEFQTRLKTTAGYYALFIVYGLTMAALGPTLPYLAEHTGGTLQAISFLFVARSAGSLLGSLLAGPLFDRLSGHQVLAVFTAMMAISLAFTPFISLLWVLFAVTLIMGLAQGGLNVGGNALLVWLHRENSGPYMNGLHFFFGVGTFLAPLVVAQSILATNEIQASYWILTGLVLLPIPYMLRRVSPRLENHPRAGTAQTGGSRLLVVLVSLFLFCYSGASNCFGGWVYTYALRLELATPVTAAYLTSVYWGALTAGRLISIPLAMRFKPALLLWVDLLGSLASVVLILLWSPDPLAIWVGSAGLGLFLASMFPTAVSYAGQRMAVTGQVTAWFSVGASLGSLVLPLAVGQFFEISGPQVLIVVLLVDLLVAIGALGWMLKAK